MALAYAPDPNKIPMSVEEYFRLDEQSEDTKYEYIDGYAVAMAGGSNNHAKIVLNSGAELRSALRDNPCSVYPSDVYLRVDTRVFHPDAAVSCTPEDEQGNMGIRHPKIIVECSTLKQEPTVAPRFIAGDSIGTETKDREEKYHIYRTIPSLEEYVMISSQRMFVEIFRREADIWWVYYPFGPGSIVEFTSINVKIPIEHLYEKVEFPEEK